MTLFSFGSIYVGIENDNFFDFSIHLGRLHLEYRPRPLPTNVRPQPKQGGDMLSDGEAGSSDRSL